MSNIEPHLAGNAHLLVVDLQDFFPSISAAAVLDVWQNFFHFPRSVAELLTKLSIKDGALPQGAITSSYLANLVLWRFEPELHARFNSIGLTYSRYVDDIAVSSTRYLTRAQQSEVVRSVYGMLAKVNLKAKRRKHETFTSSQRMVITKLVVNHHPSLPRERRAKIRAAVHQVELLSNAGLLDVDGRRLLRSAEVQVGQLGRFHPGAGHLKLKSRLALVRQAQASYAVGKTRRLHAEREASQSMAIASDPPW